MRSNISWSDQSPAPPSCQTYTDQMISAILPCSTTYVIFNTVFYKENDNQENINYGEDTTRTDFKSIEISLITLEQRQTKNIVVKMATKACIDNDFVKACFLKATC
jgi:hypothetical protein